MWSYHEHILKTNDWFIRLCSAANHYHQSAHWYPFLGGGLFLSTTLVSVPCKRLPLASHHAGDFVRLPSWWSAPWPMRIPMPPLCLHPPSVISSSPSPLKTGDMNTYVYDICVTAYLHVGCDRWARYGNGALHCATCILFRFPSVSGHISWVWTGHFGLLDFVVLEYVFQIVDSDPAQLCIHLLISFNL